MAPAAHPGRHEKGSKLKAVISFASSLEAQLPSAASSKTSPTLIRELQEHLSSFPEKLGLLVIEKYEEVDRIATGIWNICTKLRREFDSDDPQDIPLVLLLARVYAFLLLNGAHEGGKANTGNVARLMKIGIKAGKSCLERKDYILAEKVLGKVSGYEKLLANQDTTFSEDDRVANERLVAEYCVLRTALAWHQQKFDIAEYMYNKFKCSLDIFDSSTAESLADVLYEMGKGLLDQEKFDKANKWLARALEILNMQELDRLSMDANELRISIMQSLVKTFLALKTPENTEQARNMVAVLDDEVGDRLILQLLKLEILLDPSNETFDSLTYSAILHKMILTIILNENNFKLMMFHIRKLNLKSPSLACKALDDFLTIRILEEERDQWFEKVLITRLWSTTSQRDPNVFESLNMLFSKIATNITRPISADATLAAHTLMWKIIESNYTQGNFTTTEKWCQLAMHDIFKNAGELNMGRISRKLLLCALARTDIGSAREIFSSMSKTVQNEPMTRFLMYKIALRCREMELASECLQVISSSTEKEPTLLYACCLDAMNVEDKPQVLATLQLVLEKHGYQGPSTIHMPSLLRVTIGLLEKLLDQAVDAKHAVSDDNGNHHETSSEKLCMTFEGAVTALEKDRRSTKGPDLIWTIGELDWFSKNSYNIAIKRLCTWEPRFSLRMLICCIAFIDAYPNDIGEQISEDLCLRKIFCEFSASTALVAIARSEDNNEIRLQHYLKLRGHVDSFDRLLQDKIDKMGEDAEQDLLRKLSILVAFDFEAACHLKAWNELGEIIMKAECCKNSQVFEIMADCIICIHPSTQVLIDTLKKIINGAYSLGSIDIIKLAKWARCLFQISLSDNVAVAEKLLDQVHAHAEEASQTEIPYPSEELEWIATKAFNHAVDLYCGGHDEECRNWAGKAINLSHFCGDGGVLERLLGGKFMGLRFGD